MDTDTEVTEFGHFVLGAVSLRSPVLPSFWCSIMSHHGTASGPSPILLPTAFFFLTSPCSFSHLLCNLLTTNPPAPPYRPCHNCPRNPRRRQYKRRAAEHRPQRTRPHGSDQRANSHVLSVPDQAPEDEDERGAEDAERSGRWMGCRSSGGCVLRW